MSHLSKPLIHSTVKGLSTLLFSVAAIQNGLLIAQRDTPLEMNSVHTIAVQQRTNSDHHSVRYVGLNQVTPDGAAYRPRIAGRN